MVNDLFPYSFLLHVTYHFVICSLSIFCSLVAVFWSLGLHMIYHIPPMFVWLQMLAALRNSPNSTSMSSMKDCIDPNLMDLYPHDCLYKVEFNHFLTAVQCMLVVDQSFFLEIYNIKIAASQKLITMPHLKIMMRKGEPIYYSEKINKKFSVNNTNV